MDLVQRMTATQKTVDLYKRKSLVWGKFDCAQMMNAHRVHLGLKRIRIPSYGSPLSARKAIAEMGFDSLAQGMDHHFSRVEPSRVLMGDFVEMPGGQGFSGLTVSVGNGRVIGFHEDIEFADILQPLMISGAWSVE